MQGLRFDAFQDLEKISIEDEILRLWKTSRKYKDFRKYFFEVWANIFYNYTTIFIFFFAKKALDFHTTLQKFYSSVYELLTVYEW